MPHSTLLSRLCISLACFTLLWSCSGDDGSSASTDTTPFEMSFALDLWPGYYPAIVAKQRGLFAARGLDVDIRLPGNTNRMLADFSAGSHDLVAVALGDIINLTSQFREVRVILVADESSGGDAILSFEPNLALEGKRIGTNLGGFGELLVNELLVSQSISPAQVQLVNIDAEQALELLQDGSLDYAHTWEPFVTQAENAGAKVVFSSADTPGLIPDVVAIRERFAAEHPEQVKAFVAAWLEAQAWWLENRDAGNQLIAEFTNQNASDISLRGIALKNAEDNRKMYVSKESTGLEAVVKKYSDFFVVKGILAQDVDGDSILDGQYLP